MRDIVDVLVACIMKDIHEVIKDLRPWRWEFQRSFLWWNCHSSKAFFLTVDGP